MDLHQLRYFVAIVEQGSLSRAATFLHVAQPAFSLHVRNMETGSGTAPLFRTPRGVARAEADTILMRHARIILDQLTVAEEDIRRHQNDPESEVSLGVPGTIGQIPEVPLITSLNLPGQGQGLRKLPNHHAKVAKLDLNTVIDLVSYGDIKSQVEERLGYSVLPENAIAGEDAENRLRSWAIIGLRIVRNIHLAHSVSRLMTNAVSVILALVRETLRDLARRDRWVGAQVSADA